MGSIRTIKVGDWAVSPTQNLLERDGQSVKLKPRAMDVLVYLADHAGEVVSTDELISIVWQGRVVGDGTVYQSINQLRQALGDGARKAEYIETIAKRGYRLVANVEAIPASAEEVVEPKPHHEREHGVEEVVSEIQRSLIESRNASASARLLLQVHPFLAAYLKRGLPNKVQKWSLKHRVRLRLKEDDTMRPTAFRLTEEAQQKAA